MVSSYQGHLQEPVREAHPLVEGFMCRSVLTVSPDTDIYQVMSRVIEDGVSAAMVVDEDQRLLGIVSEKDLLKLAHRDAYSAEPSGGPASAYMTRGMVTVHAGQGLMDMAELFAHHPYKKLPVLQDGKLVGVVRRQDVLRVIDEHHKQRMKFLRT